MRAQNVRVKFALSGSGNIEIFMGKVLLWLQQKEMLFIYVCIYFYIYRILNWQAEIVYLNYQIKIFNATHY